MMKLKSGNQYMVKNDIEVLTYLFMELENLGVTTFKQLIQKIDQLSLKSFNDFLEYSSGPDCNMKISLIIEEIFDRLRYANANREPILTSSNEVGAYLADKLIGRKQEEFWAIYIDNNNHIVAEKMLFRGTLDKAVVHPREIFRWAMVYGCAAIFIVHNHPSGKLYPSANDIKVSQELAKDAELMQIRLLDHFIVARGRYFSLKENKLF